MDALFPPDSDAALTRPAHLTLHTYSVVGNVTSNRKILNRLAEFGNLEFSPMKFPPPDVPRSFFFQGTNTASRLLAPKNFYFFLFYF